MIDVSLYWQCSLLRCLFIVHETSLWLCVYARHCCLLYRAILKFVCVWESVHYAKFCIFFFLLCFCDCTFEMLPHVFAMHVSAWICSVIEPNHQCLFFVIRQICMLLLFRFVEQHSEYSRKISRRIPMLTLLWVSILTLCDNSFWKENLIKNPNAIWSKPYNVLYLLTIFSYACL